MEGGRALEQVPREGLESLSGHCRADLHPVPPQTDFKAADADVNTDQDIEKNLVGIKASCSGLGSATHTPRQRSCSCSSHIFPVKIESQNHYGWRGSPRPSNISLEVLKLPLLQRDFAPTAGQDDV